MTLHSRTFLYSMTGYAKLSKEGFSVEVRSYNRKYLDCEINMPSVLQAFYLPMQKIIEEFMQRGKVIVVITLSGERETFSLDAEKAAQIVQAWRALGAQLHLEVDSVLPSLLSQSALATENNSVAAENQDTLFALLRETLTAHRQMRCKEGELLANDFLSRLQQCAFFIEQMKSKEPVHRGNLENKIKEKYSGLSFLDEGLKKELASLIDKSDIQEEITRFSSHLAQMRTLIAQEAFGKGKKMEFILQEMLREANTMGAKVSDVELLYFIIELKTEVERMREQVSNVE